MNARKYNLLINYILNIKLVKKHIGKKVAIFFFFIMLPHIACANADTYINALITQAIESHPLVGSAQAERKATTESIRAAKLSILPAPTLSTGFEQDDGVVSQFQVRQSLWTGGRLTANVNQAIFDNKVAVEYVYEQQNEVAKTTIEAWQSYITAVSKQSLYYDNLQLLAEFEAMMQRRVSQGVSARVELDLITNRILQEQNTYQGTIEQQRIAIARLEQIAGRRISEAELPLPNLSELVNQAKSYSQNFERMAFDRASFYNPIVVKEHYRVEAAKQGVKSLQSSRYPTLYAQYAYAYYHDDENDNNFDRNDNGGFSIGLSYNPGAGLSNLALARASEIRVDSLVQSKEASRRLVLETIQTQYQQFASAKDQERSLIAAVAGAQIVVSSYRRQFIAGRKSWLEVLNAVREHSQYEAQLVDSRTTIIASYYKLKVDFGMMPWQSFDQSRQIEPLFSPSDSVKKWFSRQNSNESINQPTDSQSVSMKTYPISDANYNIISASEDNSDSLSPSDVSLSGVF